MTSALIAVRLWIGVMKMSELIEMLYGNRKALAGEFLKAYTEVQLDVEIDEERNDNDGKRISEKYQVS